MGNRVVLLGLLLCGCSVAAEEVADVPTTSILGAVGNVDGGDAHVTNVFAREEKNGTWTFHVTVDHKDIGVDDFADGWDVLTMAGRVLKREPSHRHTKPLRTPHVNEQPFTRTQKGLKLPAGTKSVKVRAHDKRHGYGGREIVVDLAERFGSDFTVRRRL